MIAITPAGPGDIPVLRELAHRIWHEHYPGIITREQIDYMLARMYDPEVLQREMSEGLTWLLVRHREEPVGFIAFAFNAPARRVQLHKIYLLPALHGQGFGRRMLEEVKTQAVQGNASEIVLQVNKQNSRAIRAYQRAGFVVRDSVVVDIGGGFVMDDLVMALTLLSESRSSIV